MRADVTSGNSYASVRTGDDGSGGQALHLVRGLSSKNNGTAALRGRLKVQFGARLCTEFTSGRHTS